VAMGKDLHTVWFKLCSVMKEVVNDNNEGWF
jgi:hypothetical protein